VEHYDPEVEQAMKTFFDSLSEKDRRRYAAVEVKKLGYGGAAYICRVLNIDDKTITRGHVDLEDAQAMDSKRIRKKGAGRKAS
jgi:hypothetical protein